MPSSVLLPLKPTLQHSNHKLEISYQKSETVYCRSLCRRIGRTGTPYRTASLARVMRVSSYFPRRHLEATYLARYVPRCRRYRSSVASTGQRRMSFARCYGGFHTGTGCQSVGSGNRLPMDRCPHKCQPYFGSVDCRRH